MRELIIIIQNLVPMTIAICIMVVFVVYLVQSSKRRIAEAGSVDRVYVEQILQEILQDNADMKEELADIRETVASIEKMMKDV